MVVALFVERMTINNVLSATFQHPVPTLDLTKHRKLADILFI